MSSSDEVPTISDIIKSLPRSLQNRFDSLGNYVRTMIDEIEKDRNYKTSQEDISLIQLAVFIYSLDWFLREGTRAARSSIDTLEKLGIEGFSIGSTVFIRDNENTLRGENLADGLMSSLGDSPLVSHIKKAKNMPSLIRNIRNELSHA